MIQFFQKRAAVGKKELLGLSNSTYRQVLQAKDL
jgi:hypothetical protein